MVKNVSREAVIELIAKHRIAFMTTSRLSETSEHDAQSVKSDVVDTIYHQLSGCSNGFLSEFYLTLTGESIEVIGEVQPQFACPCCGFKTLSEVYDTEKGTGYDICRYCDWEDDGTTDASKRSSVNRGSINDYRKRMLDNRNLFYKHKWLK